jgi:hypothetical protein
LLHTFPLGHALPQPPQLAGSLANVAHKPLHRTCPVVQHVPAPHNPFAHATPQAPQFAGSVASTVHKPPHAVCRPSHVVALTWTVFASSPPIGFRARTTM